MCVSSQLIVQLLQWVARVSSQYAGNVSECSKCDTFFTIGSHGNAPFRFFEENVSGMDLYMYKDTNERMIESQNESEKLCPSFRRQVFRTAGKHLAYKSWYGSPDRTSLVNVRNVKITGSTVESRKGIVPL
jgi:hypothetical protein